jgi:hypothetical protein
MITSAADTALLFFLVDVDRDAATVVLTPRPSRSSWMVTVTVSAWPAERFVNRVVDHLEHHVMQTGAVVERSPMYMPGRLRTASRPSSAVMLLAS